MRTNTEPPLPQDRPQATFRGLQGPLLDKPIPLPPAIKAEKRGSSVCNAQEQKSSSSLSSLENQLHVGSCHSAIIQKPLKIVCSTLGTPESTESLKKSTQSLEPKVCSISTLSNSGYEADEESSKDNLVNRKQTVRLTKRLAARVESSELFPVPHLSPFKNRRPARKGQCTQKSGGEK
ncbi:protein TNT [Rattus norvegicus]|uniref:Similar to human chromosome 16 open reading frame 82 n=1 Tax=Rattus norvegicus TaxID=10116 RepID=A0ABK0L9C6_RAT|nr:protein TNT [Rattus norvegicus]|eukprot:NP_001139234.1 protein TNT [Rattus norvegicus]